jgi:hypothetical protein
VTEQTKSSAEDAKDELGSGKGPRP